MTVLLTLATSARHRPGHPGVSASIWLLAAGHTACTDAPTTPHPVAFELTTSVTELAGTHAPCPTELPAPGLSWSGLPTGADWLFVTIQDGAGAPLWTAWDQPTRTGGIAPGHHRFDAPPIQGIHAGGAIGWLSPCNRPPGPLTVTAWALSRPLAAPPTTPLAELRSRAEASLLAAATATITLAPEQP